MIIVSSLSLSLLLSLVGPSSISSEKIAYDGNALILDGSVKLDHPLGQLKSESAKLQRDSKNSTFTSISLKEDVMISLRNRGKIHCASADFDFKTLQGTLNSKQEGVIRFLQFHHSLLSLACKQAEVEFSKEEDTFKLSKIDAKDTVQVEFGKDLFLEANHVIYSNLAVPHLWVGPACKLTRDRDQIEAQQIEIFPENAKVVVSSPKGKFYPSGPRGSDGLIFSCNTLIWERNPRILILKGNVCLKEKELGDLYCENEVELRQTEESGKWILDSITARGRTELSYHLDADITHLLRCNGLIHMDQNRLILSFEASPSECIEYFHDLMKISADHAEIRYEKVGHSICPRELVLSGNVRLLANQETHRCGVADEFIYFPERQEIILSSNSENFVLFWDKEQELSLSAKEIHITHTKKGESIKGIGNVRFAFSNLENGLLKKIFPFYHYKGRDDG